ncbi:MAG: helix-turn-helix transcriptional regulator [Candidatus Bipolaricaulia bacterium]
MAGKVKAYRPEGRELHPLLRSLEDFRARRGISQKRMAKKIGVAYSTYQRWLYVEDAQAWNPGLKTVERIEEVLETEGEGEAGQGRG